MGAEGCESYAEVDPIEAGKHSAASMPVIMSRHPPICFGREAYRQSAESKQRWPKKHSLVKIRAVFTGVEYFWKVFWTR